jgi:hypothetical protein
MELFPVRFVVSDSFVEVFFILEIIKAVEIFPNMKLMQEYYTKMWFISIFGSEIPNCSNFLYYFILNSISFDVFEAQADEYSLSPLP